MCEYQNTLPKSMLISANRRPDPTYRGGFSYVYEGEYESSQVAIKDICISNRDGLKKVTRVNRFLGSCLRIPYLHCMLYRISAEKLLFGDTYGTPTSYACEVRIWKDFIWCLIGWVAEPSMNMLPSTGKPTAFSW